MSCTDPSLKGSASLESTGWTPARTHLPRPRGLRGTRKSRGGVTWFQGVATTTLAGVEFVIALTFVALRGLDVAQSLIALPQGLRISTRPWLDLAALTLFLAVAVGLSVAVVRRRAYCEIRLGILDVGTGALLLLSTPYFVPMPDRFTSWEDWACPTTVSVAFGVGIVFRRWWVALTVSLGLAACYLSTTLAGNTVPEDRTTAITNSLTYLVATAIAWLLGGYLRRLGAAADEARAVAARLGAQIERDRHRNLLHDHATILDVFARSDPDNPMVAVARSRAASGSAQIRAFLRGDSGPDDSLAGALDTVAAEFPALPVTVNVGLATGSLPPATTAIVVSAVRTLLDNVAWHARASAVVLHASVLAGRWEVTVADDGVGFEAARQPRGYGLSTQVEAAVASLGGHTVITSAPGSGTSVTIEGPVRLGPPTADGALVDRVADH